MKLYLEVGRDGGVRVHHVNRPGTTQFCLEVEPANDDTQTPAAAARERVGVEQQQLEDQDTKELRPPAERMTADPGASPDVVHSSGHDPAD